MRAFNNHAGHYIEALWCYLVVLARGTFFSWCSLVVLSRGAFSLFWLVVLACLLAYGDCIASPVLDED